MYVNMPCAFDIISIHALLAESDTWQRGSRITYVISIHALLAESDLSMHTSLCCGCFDFYPRSPCGERQGSSCLPIELSRISIHALLAESDRYVKRLSCCAMYFYPRSPCGERPRPSPSCHPVLGFLSTLSLRRATGWCKNRE